MRIIIALLELINGLSETNYTALFALEARGKFPGAISHLNHVHFFCQGTHGVFAANFLEPFCANFFASPWRHTWAVLAVRGREFPGIISGGMRANFFASPCSPRLATAVKAQRLQITASARRGVFARYRALIDGTLHIERCRLFKSKCKFFPLHWLGFWSG